MMLAPLRNNAARKAVVTSHPFPASVEGWDASTALAGMRNLRAVELKNWFPQPGYVEVRLGWQRHVGGIVSVSTSVQSLMPWNGPASGKLFAAGGGAIYDATSFGTASSSVTGLSENRWQHTNMTTSAGAFLFIVNGTDAPRHYNGTTWATPTITGSGITASDFIHVNVHKKRLWFTIKDSTDAAYLPADAIAGAAVKFPLGANFDRGGHLVTMVTWTLDAGSGPDDLAAFISSEGQVAVYQGTDPASASTWALVGVFNLSEPLGRRCALKYGSAPLIITSAGVLKLSLAVKEGEAELTSTALTGRISAKMNESSRLYGSNFGWEIVVYPRGTRMIVNVPTAENSTATQYVMNTLTGAWCEFDGHNANCWAVFNDQLYFGGNDGRVYRADQTSADGQSAIVAIGQTAYSSLRSPGQLKRFTMVQPLILTEGTARVSVGVSADFVETSTISSPVGVVPATSTWDTGIWDQSVWGGQPIFVNDWTSSPALGRFASVKFIARTGVTAGVWGEELWDEALWGVVANEQVLQVNGFIVLAETGGFL